MYRKHGIKKIKADLKRHGLEYALFLTSSVIFIAFLSLFKGQHTKQFFISMIFIAYYVLWGIIHHMRDQSLHLKIVLEYIIIGGLALFLLQTLLIS